MSDVTPKTGLAESVPLAHLGEVIRANTAMLAAAVPTSQRETFLQLPVRFGTLIKTERSDLKIFAVVSFIEHAPVEPSRKVTPQGKTKDALRREMPQVFELLQTTFNAVMLGYQPVTASRAATRVYQATPPEPPELHDFVYAATADEQALFFADRTTYIRTLLNARDVNADDLITAFLRNHLSVVGLTGHLVDAGKDLAHLLKNDHRRLESIFERIFD